MDSRWFGWVLSKSYPTATPHAVLPWKFGHLLDFKCTKPMDEARQQLEVHGVSGSRSLECTQLGGELARIYPPALQWKIILLVKLICCKCKWSYFWRDLFFHFHKRKNERSGFILLLIGYDGIPLDLHFFFPDLWSTVTAWCFAIQLMCSPFRVGYSLRSFSSFQS